MPATVKRDLRTGRSVWQARRLPAIAHQPLRRDLRCEVLIIGAGISGALIADALSDAGYKVVIVDRRGPVLGSTAASTALLQYEIDTPLSTLGEDIGVTRAERIWRRSRLALDALRERSRHLGIDADLSNRDSLYLEGNSLDYSGLRNEADARRHAGFEVTVMPPSKVHTQFGIRGRAAMLSYDNLAADPRRLAAGYLRASLARGARLYAPTEIDEVQPQRGSVRACTTDGRVIRAEHLVFATGYELPKGVPRHGNYIASTWALATRAQPGKIWPGGCFIWEASDPYLYLRVGPGGSVICGGEDEETPDQTTRDLLQPKKTAAIQRKLAALFPQLDVRAEFAWCGSFGASRTGTPTIGAVPSMPNCYAALGYGGNGITFSMMAAQMIRGLLTGDGDRDLDLVGFRREF